jgi:hypothetical protein
MEGLPGGAWVSGKQQQWLKGGTISLRRVSKNYSEIHLPATILLPPQVFFPEPPSAGLDLILPMF